MITYGDPLVISANNVSLNGTIWWVDAIKRGFSRDCRLPKDVLKFFTFHIYYINLRKLFTPDFKAE